MPKIGIVGHFAFCHKKIDGQTVKALMLKTAFEKYTDIAPSYVDTFNWRKRPFSLFFQLKALFKNCDIIIMLPAHNGVKVFAHLFVYFAKKYKTKIFYDVIGGWLPDLTLKNNFIKQKLQKFDGIWVETKSMQQRLEQQGFRNVDIIPNFKDLEPIEESELKTHYASPYKFCTFSRVSKEKGITNAINAISEINKNGILALLDIYGPVAKEYQEEFNNLIKLHSDYIQYKGLVDSDKSVSVLKEYYMLLFPTFYEGEGFAGTIIDSFAAGLPIIASKWKYNQEFVKEDYTGYLHEANSKVDLINAIKLSIEQSQDVREKKVNALMEARKYLAKNNIYKILELIK